MSTANRIAVGFPGIIRPSHWLEWGYGIAWRCTGGVAYKGPLHVSGSASPCDAIRNRTLTLSVTRGFAQKVLRDGVQGGS
jgi:hypothetical protein